MGGGKTAQIRGVTREMKVNVEFIYTIVQETSSNLKQRDKVYTRKLRNFEPGEVLIDALKPNWCRIKAKTKHHNSF